MKVIIKLDEIIKELGISQRELAKMTDIRHPTIASMCKNEVKHIPLDNLAKLCETLDKEITDILELVKEKDDKGV
jgi:putative transcriptional regulator